MESWLNLKHSNQKSAVLLSKNILTDFNQLEVRGFWEDFIEFSAKIYLLFFEYVEEEY